jgi:hypothetical protein
MSEREGHPGFTDGSQAEMDPRAFELPPALASDLKREFGRSEEVPAYVDFAVLSAFESRRKISATRTRAWKFAGIAASVALVVWVGSANWPTRAPVTTVATNPAIGSGNVYGALAADSASRAPNAAPPTTLALSDQSRSASTFDLSPGKPASGTSGEAGHLAMVDADGNGRVNILDAMRIAKTVQAVQLAREYRVKTDGAGGSNVAVDQAKMAFFVASLDVTWDLTADGVVDQKDADLLTARIVRVGNGGA